MESQDLDEYLSEELIKEEIEDEEPFELTEDKSSISFSVKMGNKVPNEHYLSEKFVKEKIDEGSFKLIKNVKNRSRIWQVFANIYSENQRIKHFVCCLQCKRVCKYNGKQTSNLLRHKCIQKPATSEKERISSDEKKKVSDICTRWILKDCKPFSAVDGEGFRNMVKCFLEIGASHGPNVNVDDLLPQSTTISMNLEAIADETKNLFSAQLQEILHCGVAVTCHLWLDNFVCRNYLVVILHYIKDGKFNNVILGLKSMEVEKATASTIYKKLKEVLMQFGIAEEGIRNIIFVTNQDSNVVSALEGHQRINCSNQLLNNVLEEAFKNTLVLKETLQNCKQLIKYFKRGNLQHLIGTTVKPYSNTRWISNYSMLKSIFENWLNIKQTLQEKEESHRLSGINFELLKQIYNLTENFYQASLKLQGTDVTIHYVYILINFLNGTCAPNPDDLAETLALKESLLNGIRTKWMPNLSIYHQVGVFFYPPANKLEGFDSATVQLIKSFCLKKMKINLEKKSTETSNLKSPASTPSTFDKLIISKFIKEEPADGQLIEQEINKYCTAVVSYSDDFNVINWWESHKTEFPNLYVLAMYILSVPATSAASETAFSIARAITERHSRISPISINNLLFLHSVNEIVIFT